MIRLKLLKRWQHPNKLQPYSVGTILQCSPALAGELLADKIGEIYEGPYPPKQKLNINLSQLKTK